VRIWYSDELVLETLEPNLENRCPNISKFIEKIAETKKEVLPIVTSAADFFFDEVLPETVTKSNETAVNQGDYQKENSDHGQSYVDTNFSEEPDPETESSTPNQKIAAETEDRNDATNQQIDKINLNDTPLPGSKEIPEPGTELQNKTPEAKIDNEKKDETPEAREEVSNPPGIHSNSLEKESPPQFEKSQQTTSDSETKLVENETSQPDESPETIPIPTERLEQKPVLQSRQFSNENEAKNPDLGPIREKNETDRTTKEESPEITPEANEKIDGIWNQLPPDLERYFVFKWSSTDIPIMNLRLSSKRDLSNSYDLLNRKVKRRIERIPGVSKVELHGVEAKEIMIELKADRILAHKVDIGQLQQDLRNSNLVFSAGRITDGQKRFSVRPLVEFQSIQEIENVVISDKGLRLKDVANVRYDDPELDYGRHLDRKYAIGLEIFKESGANTVEVGDRLLAAINEIETSSDMQGIKLFFMDNAAEGIVSSIDELLGSGLWGAFFAVLVLYLFLRRISTTLIVALAIPFSLIMTLGFMYFLGMSLNILTMMGLMLSVGMLVDNAVVITESIFRHQQRGETPEQATSIGIKEVGLAVAAATSTTAIVFLPFIMSPEGEVATYMKHVSVTIIIAMAASLLIAQTLIPLLTSRIKFKAKKTEKKILFEQPERYRKILDWTLGHPGYATLIIFGILASTVLPIMNVKIDMFPDRDDRRLRLRYRLFKKNLLFCFFCFKFNSRSQQRNKCLSD